MATEGKEYDLADKNQLAAFLEDADIQLGGPGTRRISKDALHFIVRNLKGDRFTVEMLQDIFQELVPDREGLLNCEDVARCLRRPDPPSEPQEPKRYDLAQKQGLADFLKDADIRLVRADFILKLHREGQRFPRRQEAESAYVDSRTALVTHEEVQDWADGEGMKQNRTLKRLSLAGDLREVDLTGCDLGQAVALALARALRTGQVQVKGTITHPALEFLSMLEDYEFQKLRELEETQSLGLRLWGDEAQFRKLFAPLCRALPELKLRWLSLWLGVHGRRFGADEARALAAGLGQQTELERLTLDLFNNSLGNEGGKAVASALARLTELKELRLDLAENKIGDAGAAAVAESLRNLRQLTVLKVYLRSNALGDAGATAVVESLRELPQLTEVVVQLENNDLGQRGEGKAPGHLCCAAGASERHRSLIRGLSLGALVAFLPSASEPPKKV